MTMTIDLTPDLEARVFEGAARQQISPDRFVLKTLAECFHQAEPTTAHFTKEESLLMQRISEGLPEETWLQYHDLTAKRKAETLTPEQQQLLIALSDEVEQDYAQRLSFVLELARLHGISLEAQMQALGIPQYSYE